MREESEGSSLASNESSSDEQTEDGSVGVNPLQEVSSCDVDIQMHARCKMQDRFSVAEGEASQL